MEKISRILPSGRRFQNIDQSNAHPVRPGAPDFKGASAIKANSRLAASQLVDDVQDVVKISAPAARLVEPAEVNTNEEVVESPIKETIKFSPAKEEKFKEEPTSYRGTRPVESNKVRDLASRFFSPQTREKVEVASESRMTESAAPLAKIEAAPLAKTEAAPAFEAEA